jgi:hypothetical protein
MFERPVQALAAIGRALDGGEGFECSQDGLIKSSNIVMAASAPCPEAVTICL